MTSHQKKALVQGGEGLVWGVRWPDLKWGSWGIFLLNFRGVVFKRKGGGMIRLGMAMNHH